MPQPSGSQSPDQPTADFGANEWLVEEMYDQFQKDPGSLDPAWRKYFETHGNGTAGGTNGQASAKASTTTAEKAQPKPAQKPTSPAPSQEPAREAGPEVGPRAHPGPGRGRRGEG